MIAFRMMENSSCETILELPNIFTPNDDGINDRFIPTQMENIQQASLQIVDRWGFTVFSTDDITTGWDGRIDDQPCTDGVYFWIVRFVDVMGTDQNAQGFVTVLSSAP